MKAYRKPESTTVISVKKSVTSHLVAEEVLGSYSRPVILSQLLAASHPQAFLFIDAMCSLSYDNTSVFSCLKDKHGIFHGEYGSEKCDSQSNKSVSNKKPLHFELGGMFSVAF